MTFMGFIWPNYAQLMKVQRLLFEYLVLRKIS